MIKFIRKHFDFIIKIIPIKLTREIVKFFILINSIFKLIFVPFISIKRLLETNFYNSPYVGLGERRNYSFPKKWICVDWKNADFNIDFKNKSKLPFRDNSKEIFFTAHLLEHIGFEAAQYLFEEVYRSLKPGGSIRIEVPDFDIFLSAYRNNDRTFIEKFNNHHKNLIERFNIKNPIDEDHIVLINAVSNNFENLFENGGLRSIPVSIPCYAKKEIFEKKLKDLNVIDFINWCVGLQSKEQLKTGGHQCGYNFDILRDMLTKSKFSKISKCSFGNTNINNLNISSQLKFNSILEKEHRQHMSIYVEATK